MTEQHPTPPPGSIVPETHAGPDFKAYMNVFYILCGLTLASFVSNELARRELISVMASVSIIVGVAFIKALCVILIFMHLKYDWSKLYCIVIPVSILAVMMIIVLLPDTVLGWKRDLSEVSKMMPAAEVKKN